MAYVHVGHDGRLGDRVIIANATQLSGHCTVGDRANISGVVGVGQFIRIGAYSITSGGSSLNQDVAPYGMVSGVTAELVGINLIGLKRAGFTPDEVAGVKKAYRILFMSDLPLTEAITRTREELGGSTRVLHLLDFVESSKKGVCRMRSKNR